MKLRIPVLGAALALAGSLVLVPGAVAHPAPAPAPGRASLAAGTLLVLVDHGPADGATVDTTSQTLELVSPAGVRTVVYTHAVPYADKAVFLADWSKDGATALLAVAKRHGEALYRVDVATGTATSVPGSLIAEAILDPTGKGVIVERFLLHDAHHRLGLTKIAWDGAQTPLHAFVDGDLLAGPGQTVVTGGDRPGSHQVRVISLRNGHVLHSRSTSGYCQPVRMYDRSHALVRCGRELDLVAPRTGVLSSLAPGPKAGDEGIVDAQELDGGTYLETVTVCDVDSIARLAGGRLHPLAVPGAGGGLNLVGTTGGDLVLRHTGPCLSRRVTPPRGDVSLFDPATRAVSTVFTPGVGEDLEAVAVLGEMRVNP